MIWFTADTHYGHNNIIKYCNRPFRDIHEMNEALIDNINTRVSHSDTLYHLGDVAFGERNIQNFLKAIKCRNIDLILGNHDKDIRRNVNQIRTFFTSVSDLKEIRIDNTSITLCHYCMKVWNKSHHGAYHLWGHSHGTLPDDPNARSIDVGVDCHNYCPISFEDIKRIMAKKIWKPIDHHGDN